MVELKRGGQGLNQGPEPGHTDTFLETNSESTSLLCLYKQAVPGNGLPVFSLLDGKSGSTATLAKQEPFQSCYWWKSP